MSETTKAKEMVFWLIPTYGMLMNVYVVSWLLTGGAIFVVYVLYMRKLEEKQRKQANNGGLESL